MKGVCNLSTNLITFALYELPKFDNLLLKGCFYHFYRCYRKVSSRDSKQWWDRWLELCSSRVIGKTRSWSETGDEKTVECSWGTVQEGKGDGRPSFWGAKKGNKSENIYIFFSASDNGKTELLLI